MFRYSNDSLIGLDMVRQYFLACPFKTKKGESFSKWNDVYSMLLNKEPLTGYGLISIRAIAKTLDLVDGKSTQIGSARP